MTLDVAGQALSLPSVLLLGVGVGLVAGMFGVGGGFILTPLLSVVFRLPLPIAVGTGLCQMIGTSVVALLRHGSLGQGERRFDVLMLAGSMVGVAAGARAVQALEQAGDVAVGSRMLPAATMGIYGGYVVFLAAVAAMMWSQGRGTVEKLEYVRRGPMARIALGPRVDLPSVPLSGVSALVVSYTGLLLGFLSGVLGIGGGVALMPVLLYGFGFPIRQAAGTGIIVLLVTSIVGTVAHAFQGHVHLGLAMALLVGSSISAQVGALLTSRLPARVLRRSLAGLVLATVGAIAWDLARQAL